MLTLVRRRGTAIAAAEGRRGRYAGALLAVATVVVGLTATALTVAGLRTAQRENAGRVMDQRTDMARAAVLAESERYRSLVEAIADGLATDTALTWEDFDAATAPLVTARLIGAVSVAFVVPSRTADVPATQRRWRARGADGLVLKPSGTGDEHYFTIFSRGLQRTARNGVDLAAAAQPMAALIDARRMSRPTVSETYVLLRDRDLPAAQQQRSFVFAAPIWPRDSDPQFRGWIVLGMHGQDFLNGVLATVSQGQLDAELVAPGAGGDRPVVASYTVPGKPDLKRSRLLDVADREWELVTRAHAAHLPGARSSLPGAVLGGGAAITLILAGLIYVLATGRFRAWSRVQDATADLRAAEAESRRQAGLLGAVMASISDGVGVVDEQGEFLLHNPAAQLLLGVGDTGDPDGWQSHYGLFLPDGHTPFPLDQLPLMRALRGESTDGVEMVIRNRSRPEGILISVNGRPLDASAGQHGAVAVFHDITEVRRYEADLAVFAGVVAHDLKAPLTVVRGHCEAAEEALDDGSPDRARHALDRMERAANRMSAMIDTLLAYTTARDAPLRIRPVDLGALVAEVLHDRTAHLPPAELPQLDLGPLPAVSADPAMLRHVLDNLVGNALKYLRPETTARLEVTGSAGPPGWCRIEVADRGIGIPDADKPAIFERFHRAHAEDGYAGTGLGLAICQRIVERHGGEIGVADNPGGGTRFHFTLPCADSAPPTEEKPMSTSDDHRADEEARARLERALAERAAMEDLQLPGMTPHVDEPKPVTRPAGTPHREA